ncbi:MAG TPA: CGNR zinc finger domain-containing protein [Gammaproteobacteria bacterium]|jgi:predicted RNA-binding Zn ribbon-like protein
MQKAISPLQTSPKYDLATYAWVGGHVALDFANTLSGTTTDHPSSHLHGYHDLLDWAERADLIGPVGRKNLSAGSAQAQAAAFKESQLLNRTLGTLFRAAARHEALPQESLDHLNNLVQKTAAWRRISACDDEGRKVSCGWDFQGAPPVAVLGPIVWRAVELLEYRPLGRVKECGADDCGWLFLDTSKNGSRQWCSMQTCGNVSKVRRFRDRQKGG